MPRYFLEVAYKGTHFSGFQAHNNANTIQGEINKVLSILCKEEIQTTTSSRTDAGVHAHQNFLHFDCEKSLHEKIAYNVNAMLHKDIFVVGLYLVHDNAHARFDATGRNYHYYLIQHKNPFLYDTSYFFPFTLNVKKMQEACSLIIGEHDFTSFSKKHSEVNNNRCTIQEANWIRNEHGQIVFKIVGNRFLRGMVRGIVGTLLLVGREKLNKTDFSTILQSKDNTLADFSADASGLFLHKVMYPSTIKKNNPDL
mgnify:CR=1 FL=1